MKKTVVLACETISEEVLFTANSVQTPFPIIWVESGLHNNPDRLKKQLQADIRRIDNADYILLLFGYCGNSILDLVSENSSLVIPKADDCISLLLGGNKPRNSLNAKAMAYFLTNGWLQHENNLWSEYQYCLKKYGIERTRKLYQMMLGNYHSLNVINTGAYNLEELLPVTKQIAAELGLTHTVVEGSLGLIEKALRGQWDDEFAIIEPGRPVSLHNLGVLEKQPPGQLKIGNPGG
ncbi:MAG: DUF1638 domain-containing protein [Bacillota bacterium]